MEASNISILHIFQHYKKTYFAPVVKQSQRTLASTCQDPPDWKKISVGDFPNSRNVLFL